ncbi:MAG: type I methionyl aminopeptidase [Candidatus Makaraimicrobium thalassicum]|nr:MAG: type I methionyl aminopeptidase [Candidatus Omnitrophota bacterium]
MTLLTSEGDVRKMRECGRIIREIFPRAEKRIRAGVSTADLDREIEDIIREQGAEPAFKGYKGYPATICASVNEVVVHGIPSDDTILAEGDIVGIDVGVKKNGYFGDAARTFTVGKISEEAARLIEVTRECLSEGISQAIAGNRVSDISNTIQRIAQREGFEEVRTFVGHGIGTHLHEPPEVPNWGARGTGPVLKEGQALAIEPMINTGTRNIRVLSDGWTAVTTDGKLSAHFEDTIIVGRRKAEIIT